MKNMRFGKGSSSESKQAGLKVLVNSPSFKNLPSTIQDKKINELQTMMLHIAIADQKKKARDKANYIKKLANKQ